MINDPLQLFGMMVLQEFEFLPKDFDFELVRESDYHFIARSPNCHILIDFDRNVVGCWIERLDIPEKHPHRGIAVEWIAMSFGYRDDELRFSTAEESITRQIKVNAKLLKEYCSEFLQGNFSGWNKVIEYINEQGELEEKKEAQEELERFLSEMRQKADSAWIEKDYPQIITLYETIDQYLTTSERKRLEYSKKHALAE